MELLQNEIETFFKKTKVTEELLELRNLAACGMLIIRSAMKRRETRGLQVRTDYPERNDTEFLCDTVVD
jgi:L-aspartate oxidase